LLLEVATNLVNNWIKEEDWMLLNQNRLSRPGKLQKVSKKSVEDVPQAFLMVETPRTSAVPVVGIDKNAKSVRDRNKIHVNFNESFDQNRN